MLFFLRYGAIFLLASCSVATLACSSSSSPASTGGGHDGGSDSGAADAAEPDGGDAGEDGASTGNGGEAGSGLCAGTLSGGISGPLQTCTEGAITATPGTSSFTITIGTATPDSAGVLTLNTQATFSPGTYEEGAKLWNGMSSVGPAESTSTLGWITDAGQDQVGCAGPASAMAGGGYPACTSGVLVVKGVDSGARVHGTFDLVFPAQGSEPSVTVHVDL